ncbi:MAG: DUF4214 domain-containing protein [Desulfobacterales bacterium]|nr:MAG: DUF4214 domain-containing protein [Desulfobacterales bacterium]
MLKRITISLSWIFWVLGMFCLSSGHAAEVVTYDFDDGTFQGWTSEPSFGGTLSVDGSGGNPGGFMVATDSVPLGLLLARAPGLFGDLSGLESIQWDEFVYDNGTRTEGGTFVWMIGNNGSVYHSSNALEVIGEWNTRSIRFDDPSAWTLVGTSSFEDVVQNAKGIYFAMDTSRQAEGGRESGIDNVVFTFADTQPPDAIRALIRKYYNDILDREPEPAGEEGWNEEILRIVFFDLDIKEGFIALARFFFNSDEYLGKNKSDEDYVTDLYQTFFSRAPDAAGFDFWVGLLNQGLSRNVILNFFVFSDEYQLFMADLLGSGVGKPEVNLVNDMYRGLLSRLPDTAGLNAWVAEMQDAMAAGEQAVRDLARQITLGFLQSEEYVLRDRSDEEFLEDLYNGILRRGAEKEEFDGWLNIMANGMTRPEVLEQFTLSLEFQLRVQAIVDAAATQ